MSAKNDHLLLETYGAKLLGDVDPAVYPRAFDRDVRARVVVNPSFSKRHAIGISKRDGQYRIFVEQPREQFEPGLEDEPSDAARAAFSDVAIDRLLGEELVAIWHEMLLRAAVPEQQPMGFDGTTYSFSLPDDGNERAGHVWSPRAETLTGALVELAETMRNYCWTRNERVHVRLERVADFLMSRLAGPPAAT